MASLLHKRDGSATYTFSSHPRSLQQRKKYRDHYDGLESQTMYGNIMYDRRIVRGNTYAQNVLPPITQPDIVDLQKKKKARLAIASKRAKQQLKSETPEPVTGRQNVDVQTELYLEELADHVEEMDVQVQTDAFLDRPVTPLFIPAKTGIDVATQIIEGELFDFDIEVKPILEVLAGKTIEQSLLEVMEEEELCNLRVQQRHFEQLRHAELMETQRLEEQERRHREEKERRRKQQEEVLKKERETTEKIAARAFAQSYLQDLVPSVFGTLHEHGYFYDPVERDIETNFMPWLMSNVTTELTKVGLARSLLDSIIADTFSKRETIFKGLDEEIGKRIQFFIENAALLTKEPTTVPKELTIVLEEPTTDPEEPTTIPEEPTTDPEEPTTIPQEPTTDSEEPTIIPQEPTTIPQEPTTISEEPTIDPEEQTTIPEEPTTVPEEPTIIMEEPTTVPEDNVVAKETLSTVDVPSDGSIHNDL